MSFLLCATVTLLADATLTYALSEENVSGNAGQVTHTWRAGLFTLFSLKASLLGSLYTFTAQGFWVF